MDACQSPDFHKVNDMVKTKRQSKRVKTEPAANAPEAVASSLSSVADDEVEILTLESLGERLKTVASPTRLN